MAFLCFSRCLTVSWTRRASTQRRRAHEDHLPMRRWEAWVRAWQAHLVQPQLAHSWRPRSPCARRFVAQVKLSPSSRDLIVQSSTSAGFAAPLRMWESPRLTPAPRSIISPWTATPWCCATPATPFGPRSATFSTRRLRPLPRSGCLHNACDRPSAPSSDIHH